MTKNSIKMVLAIFAFSLIAALTISFVHQKTEEAIRENETKAKRTALSNVLSGGSTEKSDQLDGFGEYWTEFDENGKIIGYAFIGAARGYSGIIRFFCGIDLNGKIRGLSIISQSETPGLGARITEVVSNSRFPFGLWQKGSEETHWFGEQFRGISTTNEIHINRNVAEWHELSASQKDELIKRNEITLITGSTITVRAIKEELSARAKKLMALLETRQLEEELPAEDLTEEEADVQ
jgi:electron transport complex protein RnfG